MDCTAKLGGYEFYRTVLGSPKYIMAPMVEGSDLPFRLLAKRYNTDMVYTPMLYSRLFVVSPKYREKYFQTVPEERPLVVQFAGTDPDEILAAALLAQDRCDAIDINLGCPQRCAQSGGYGAYLLENSELVFQIVRKLHENLKVPVFCKIRILPSDEDTLRLARGLQENGCQLLVVHGRTKEQKRDKTGPANWDIIKKVKEALTIPVIANGGLVEFDDMDRCLAYTQCDGIMSACSMLDNPCFFAKQVPDKFEIVFEYLDICKTHKIKIRNVNQHVFTILKNEFLLAPEIREEYSDLSEDYAVFMEEAARVLLKLKTFIDALPLDKRTWKKTEKKAEEDVAISLDWL